MTRFSKEEESQSVQSSLALNKVVDKLLVLIERAGDLLVNFVLIFPCTIAFWRGVWQLIDCYIAHYENLDPWISLAVGFIVLIVLYGLQDPIRNTIDPLRMNHFSYNFLSRLILILHAIANVNHWRGLWKLFDLYVGLDLTSAIISLLVGLILCVPFKTFGSSVTPPMFCSFDEFPLLHESPLRFNSSIKTKGKVTYVLDCIFTVSVSISAVALVWRGLWNLLDLYLYKNDPKRSMEVSLVAGYAICVSLIISFDLECLSEWVTIAIGVSGGLALGCISTFTVRLRPLDGCTISRWPVRSISLELNPEIH